MEIAAGETLSSLGVTTVRSVRQPVASLSGGQRQSVAVAKAVMWHSQLVIMDEPTAALGVTQTEMVPALIQRLRDVAELKALLETGLTLFTEHQHHAEMLAAAMK